MTIDTEVYSTIAFYTFNYQMLELQIQMRNNLEPTRILVEHPLFLEQTRIHWFVEHPLFLEPTRIHWFVEHPLFLTVQFMDGSDIWRISIYLF